MKRLALGLALAGAIVTSALAQQFGYSQRVESSITRPANTTAYASGQLVANSTTAGSVTPFGLQAARVAGGSGRVRRVEVYKSGTSLTNASFRVHLYGSLPTPANGDGAAWSTSRANYLGSFDVTVDKAFTDGAAGVGVPLTGTDVVFNAASGSANIYALIEARAAYTPVSAEVFGVVLEVLPN
jgi:hypothetical protein